MTMGMIRFVLPILMICSDLVSSEDRVISFVNGTEFMEGDAVEMICAFPAKPQYETVMWIPEGTTIRLTCSPSGCVQRPNFKVSRNGYNTTLIIKHVPFNQTKWKCTDISEQLNELIIFNVITNPRLVLTITESSSQPGFWEVTTSCSNPLPKLTCNNSISEIDMDNITTNKCNTSLLSSIKTFVPHTLHPIRCRAVRGNTSVDAIGTSKLVTTTLGLTTDAVQQILTTTFATQQSTSVNGTSKLVTTTLGLTTDAVQQILTTTFATQQSTSVNGAPKSKLTVKILASCIYKIETPCSFIKYNFKCVNEDKPMHFDVVGHPCENSQEKYYRVELKSVPYGTTFNCNISAGGQTYPIQRTVSCHLPYYISGGFLISLGLLFVGVAVMTYLFKIGTILATSHNKTIWSLLGMALVLGLCLVKVLQDPEIIFKVRFFSWKIGLLLFAAKLQDTIRFALWYLGIMFVDIGILLFMWTLSWEFLAAVFFPFFLLFILKNVSILLIGLYVKKNGGFFFMHSAKVCTERATTNSPTYTPSDQILSTTTAKTPTRA